MVNAVSVAFYNYPLDEHSHRLAASCSSSYSTFLVLLILASSEHLYLWCDSKWSAFCGCADCVHELVCVVPSLGLCLH